MSGAGLAGLHPSYFAMVMATGIVSIAAHLLGMPAIAGALFWLNLALYPLLGVQGLALSFSVAYGVAALMALRSLSGRVGGLGLDLRSRQVLARTAVAATVMTLAVILALVVLPGRPPAFVEAAVGVVAGVVVYAAALSAMRVREVAEIVRRLRGRVGG